MKNFVASIFLFFLFSNPFLLFSQQKCKVLLPAISESYAGKCKKGLANGKGTAIGIDTYEGRFSKGYPNGIGTYTWASGEEYIGEWNFGVRHGEGIYRFMYQGKDSIQAGIWKDDKYMGPKPPPPSIYQSRNVQQYSFIKLGDKNKFSIEIYMNAAINSTIENLRIISSVGSYRNLGKTIVYDYIEYPATFKITYITWNKLHAKQLDVVFEFEIYEPGDWMLRITN